MFYAFIIIISFIIEGSADRLLRSFFFNIVPYSIGYNTEILSKLNLLQQNLLHFVYENSF